MGIVSHENSQRTAVKRRAFGASNAKCVAGEDRFEGGEGEIEDVLVINSIKFALGNHFGGIRKFKNGAAFGGEQCIDARDEIIDVRSMGEDVVGEDEIGLVFGCQFLREFFGEKIRAGLHSVFASDGGDVFRGFDAEMRRVGLDEMMQEIAVVAGDFDDVIGREVFAVARGAFGGVLRPRVGVGRKINVIAE